MNKSGKIGEDLAAEYLQRKGYEIIARNWRGVKGLRSPEIDIIAGKNNVIIFVEVKTSSTGKFGSPEYWITPAKRQRITSGAQAFLAQYTKPYEEARFDAIVIDRQTKPVSVNHIKNAFFITDFDNE